MTACRVRSARTVLAVVVFGAVLGLTHGREEAPSDKDISYRDVARSDAPIRILRASPNFRVYATTDDDEEPTAYLQLKFGSVQELDSSGHVLEGHQIASLASKKPTWSSGQETIDGKTVYYARTTLGPLDADGLGSHFKPCTDKLNTAQGRRLAQQAEPASFLRITIYFGFTADATSFPYGGSNTVVVPKGGVKINIEQQGWPFCSPSNSLRVKLQVLTHTSQSPVIEASEHSEGVVSGQLRMSKRGKVALGNVYQGDLIFLDYATDGKAGEQRYPVQMDLRAKDGTALAVQLTFPAVQYMYYDPTFLVSNTGIVDNNPKDRDSSSAPQGARPATLPTLLTTALLAIMLTAAILV